MTFRTDADASAHNFTTIVQPKLMELGWLRGEIISAEDESASDALKELDTSHGIDYVYVTPDGGYEGVASRVEYNEYPYHNFTTRQRRAGGNCAQTEFEKVRSLIDASEIAPITTVHACITRERDGELIAVAMAKVVDIYAVIDDGRGVKRRNPKDGCEFLSVQWSDVVDAQVWMNDATRYEMWRRHCAKKVI